MTMHKRQLSEEEWTLIQKVRARNAEAIGYNKGAQAGMDFIHDRLNDKMDMSKDTSWSCTEINSWIADAIQAGQLLVLREIKL